MKRAIVAIVLTLLALYLMVTYRPATAPLPDLDLPGEGNNLLIDDGSTTSVLEEESTTTVAPTSSAPPQTSPSGSMASTSSVPAPTTTRPPATSTTSAARTFTGQAASTRYGPVQVAIVVQNGRMTAINVLDYPRANDTDIQINSRAIPQLRSSALQAQSANVPNISGATYTSSGFKTSLQSAMGQAGL